MLSQFLVSQLFAFMLIFCRLGAAFVVLPGFGESYVSPRVRLFIAVMFSLTLVPVIRSLPAIPVTTFGLLTLIIGEILVGAFLGGLARMLVSAVHIAGTVIAFQSSLASALTLDITQFQGQDSSISNLLSMVAITLLFATNMHHLMLTSLANSYSLFVPGQFPIVEDFANHAVQTINGVFHMAMQLAAPHIVIGLILYLGAGIISRLMPNIQIFFIMMAPQILISFFVFMIAFSSIMMWYLDYFKNSFTAFLAP